MATAAVGGAGTALPPSAASFNVPVAAAAGCGHVDLAVLDCVLQVTTAPLLLAMHVNTPAAADLELRLRNVHEHARGLSADASAGRLVELRVSGTADDASTKEREYAALFKPLRAARDMMVARLSTAVDAPLGTVGPGAGPTLPAEVVADVLALGPPELLGLMEECGAALTAAAPLAAALAAAYADEEYSADRIAVRLYTLQLVGGDGVEKATASERVYAEHLKPVRGLRRAVKAALIAALAPTAPRAPTPASPTTVSGVLAVLAEHERDATAAAAACRQLATLAGNSSKALRIAMADGVKRMTSVLKPHLPNAAVVTAVAEVLRNIACIADPRAPTDSGCIPLLVIALATHTADASAAASVCGALNSIAREGSNSAALLKAGVIVAVASAMRAQAASAAVTQAGCNLLGSLVFGADEAEAACSTRAAATSPADVCADIAESGGLDAVLAALTTHAGSAVVVEAALNTLASLVVFGEASAALAADNTHFIVAAFARHASSPGVASAACALLHAMLKDKFDPEEVPETAAKLCFADGGIAALVTALQIPGLPEDAVLSAIRVFLTIASEWTFGRAGIVDAGGIAAVVAEPNRGL